MITIGTLFYKLKEVGIKPQTADTAETAGLPFEDSISKTPLFPDEVYELLPDLLKELTHPLKGRAKDIVLVSSLSVLSASFPNTKGIYRGKEYYPNLFTLIIAPSGSDKGRAEFAKILASKIDDEVRSSYKLEKEGNKKILKRSHIIPGNTSLADIVITLIGSRNALIAESELDVIGNNFKQDWGNFSHIFRQAFEHEMIQRSRKDEDIIKIEKPKLSVSLTGTFNQAPKFFENLEDGLYNRFGVYTFSETPKFDDPFADTIDYGKLFLDGASKIYDMYTIDIQMGGSIFSLTKQQKEQFTKIFKNLLVTDYLKIGNGAAGIVFRLAVQQFRIAMLLSKLRYPSQKELVCNDDDYKTSFMIIEIFMTHTLDLYNRLKKRQLNLDSFYEELPSDFQTGKAIELGKHKFDIGKRVVHDKLSRYIHKGALIKLKHGHYKKL